MNKLISITQNAADQIKKILMEAPDGVDSVIVGVDKSGCSGYSYKLDFAKSADIKNFDCIEENGATVFVDPKASMFLIGSTMDYKKDKFSSKFIFNNPNEKNTCGCGESFSI